MPRRIVFVCLIAAAVAPLAGCGQKGPLTLPPAKPAVVAPAATAAQPAATTPAPPATVAPATATSAG